MIRKLGRAISSFILLTFLVNLIQCFLLYLLLWIWLHVASDFTCPFCWYVIPGLSFLGFGFRGSVSVRVLFQIEINLFADIFTDHFRYAARTLRFHVVYM